MSYKKTARPIFTEDQSDHSTTARFVRNHSCPEHLLEQVQSLYAKGHIEETIHLVECIVKAQNDLISSADLFVIYAKSFIELQGYSIEAKCALKQALLNEPNNARALQLQSLCDIHELLRDGMYDKAEAMLREQLEAKPDNAYAAFLLGHHLFWKNGPQTEAIEILQSCTQARPSFLQAWLCLGMAHKKGKSYEGAEAAFQRCLDLDYNQDNHEYYRKHLQSM